MFLATRDEFCADVADKRWLPLAAFPLKISDDVSSSGSGAEIAASSHGVGGGGVLIFQICTISFFKRIPGIFRSALVRVANCITNYIQTYSLLLLTLHTKQYLYIP